MDYVRAITIYWEKERDRERADIVNVQHGSISTKSVLKGDEGETTAMYCSPSVREGKVLQIRLKIVISYLKCSYVHNIASDLRPLKCCSQVLNVRIPDQ